MISCAIVIIAAAEGLNGQALQRVLPSLQGEASHDLICIDNTGNGVDASEAWSIATVWDYPDEQRDCLQGIASSLRQRLEQVSGNGGYACIIWHEQSASSVKKTAFNQGLNGQGASAVSQNEHAYTRQGDDKLYEAILAVLNARCSPQNYKAAVNRLCAHLVPVYQWAVDILSAFLPADLIWQVDGVNHAKAALDDGQLRRSVSGRFGQLKNALSDFACQSNDIDKAVTKVEQYLCDPNGHSLYDTLGRNPEAFHENYKDLRDQLFVLVETMEKTQQDIA